MPEVTENSESAASGPAAALYALLGEIHLDAGMPSTRWIERASKRMISHTTVAKVLKSPHISKWPNVEVVTRCLEGDTARVRLLWKQAQRQAAPIEPDEDETASRPRFELPSTLPGVNARQEQLEGEERGIRREYDEVKADLFAAYEERATIDDRILDLRSEIKHTGKRQLEAEVAELRLRRDRIANEIKSKEKELEVLRSKIAEMNEELKEVIDLRAGLLWMWARSLEEAVDALKRKSPPA